VNRRYLRYSPTVSSRAKHILTVDVEDWFHILEVDGTYVRDEWAGLESRVEANTDRLLAWMAEAGARATFFVVGWVAERHVDLVRRIARAGHELASHSYWHEVVGRHDRRSLAADLERSRKLLEDLSGARVEGFRAPGGSITPACAWAFDLILEKGYRYDASIWPGHSSHGGFPTPYEGPHWLRTEAGELVEIPASTVGWRGVRVPYAGGGYFRLLPGAAIRGAMAANARRGQPTTFYVHPRDFDLDQPRMKLPAKRYFKYYVGLRGAEAKLRSLLRDYAFVSAREWIAGNEAALADRLLDVRSLRVREPRPDPALVPPLPPARGA